MSTAIDMLESSPEICGGRIRINGTRVTVGQIVMLYKQGENPDGIVNQYPHLSLAQVDAALRYYRSHQKEVEAALLDEGLEAERLELECQGTPKPDANTPLHR